MLGVGLFGTGELDQLDLLELMLADDAARVLARRARLGAEAGRVGRQTDRQPRLVQNLVAIKIGDRNLGGWYQPVIIVFVAAVRSTFGIGVRAAEQILGKLGQLPGAEERLAVDHKRRQHFRVAVASSFARARVQVEHEADQRPFEARSGAHVHRKARARELGRALQVENAQRLAQLPVRLGLEVEGWLLAPGFDGDVVGLGFACGHFVAGQVGNPRQQLAQPVVQGRGGRVQIVELFLERPSLFDQRSGGLISFGAGLFQRAHLLAQLVAASLQPLGGGDGLAPALIERTEIAQERRRVSPARAQFFFHNFQVAAYKS